MTDTVDIPILVDGDTGFGNFNNARLFTRNLEKIGVAGVCIEDKLFPKNNSFLNTAQELASIEEFTGKIKACRDIVNSSFFIVARIEALIANAGIDEALKRAYAYIEAGANAIVIHSKKSNGKEIIEFLKLFNNKAPVIIIPTKYYTVPTQIFKELNVAGIVWANHNMRASVRAMEETCLQIFQKESLTYVEKKSHQCRTFLVL